MAKKSNIRSIRFSDELAELIDRQVGDTFTQKFEGLITRCVWELPQKEKELERLESRITERRGHLQQMYVQAEKLTATLRDLQFKTDTLKTSIDRAVRQWDE